MLFLGSFIVLEHLGDITGGVQYSFPTTRGKQIQRPELE